MVGQTLFFSLGEATSLGEGKLHLKIDRVSYPARAEGLVNMDMSKWNDEKIYVAYALVERKKNVYIYIYI